MMTSILSPSVLLVLAVVHLTWRMGESSYAQDSPRVDSIKLSKSFTSDETCPCDCHNDTVNGHGLIVDCSSRGHPTIPPGIPHTAVELDLNNNNIQRIPGDIFSNLSLLETLDLSENVINALDEKAFAGLVSLRNLRLNNNNLNISKGLLTPEVLSPLSRLTQLDISANVNCDYVNFKYPDSVLGQLIALTSLHIDGVSNRTFGPGFKNLTSLISVDLSGTRTFQYILKNMFEAFHDISLKHLNLCHCDLQWIHPEAFSSLPNIDTIDLSYNVKLDVHNAMKSVFGLRNTTIRKLFFQSVHTGPIFTRVTAEDCISLGLLRLEELHLDYNFIDQFDKQCIPHLPVTMQILSVSRNNLQTYGGEVYALLLHLRNLRVFNASFQITYTEMEKSPNWTFHSPLDHLDQHSSNRDHIDKQILNNEPFIASMPINLSVVSFSHTHRLSFPIPWLVLLHSYLKVVDVSNNQLNPWVGPIEGMETVTDFDLSGNDCENVSPVFFAYATGLQRLNIGQNKLGPKLNDLTFHNLSNIEVLDLSHNRLEHATSELFYRLTTIRYLNISYNAIVLWEARMASLQKLSLLDLRSNRLSAPPLSLLEDLDVIQMLTNVTVIFLDNPLRCSCETQYFLQWLTETRVLISDLNITTCSLFNGTLLYLSDKRVILDILKEHCRSFAPVVAALSITTGLILCVIAVKILHRYRWKLRYFYYMAIKRGERTGYLTLDGTAQGPFAYDAFVSYEDADRDFIKHNVLPKLEDKEKLKLCIDRRDFTPGMYITENIMKAIQNSRKTVVLLSKEFLKSKWCMYEMNMARMESLYNGRETLVIVMMEKLDARDLTAEVLEILHSQSYIEKTADPIGEDLFWKKLAAAIKEHDMN